MNKNEMMNVVNAVEEVTRKAGFDGQEFHEGDFYMLDEEKVMGVINEADYFNEAGCPMLTMAVYRFLQKEGKMYCEKVEDREVEVTRDENGAYVDLDGRKCYANNRMELVTWVPDEIWVNPMDYAEIVNMMCVLNPYCTIQMDGEGRNKYRTINKGDDGNWIYSDDLTE